MDHLNKAHSLPLDQNIATICFGPKSTQLASSLFYLESQQVLEEQEDHLNHQAFFRNYQDYMSNQDSHLIPRAVFYDFKNNLNFLDLQNYYITNYQNNQDIMMPTKQVQVNQVTEQNERICEYNDQFIKMAQTQAINSNFNHEFDNFFMGQQLFAGEDDTEEYYEKIRKMIEREDFTPNFQILIDSDGGFGIFGEKILEMLTEECPKMDALIMPLFSRGDKKTQILQEMQVVNEMLSLSSLKNLVGGQMTVPLHLDEILGQMGFNYFNLQKDISKERSYLTIAPLISNFTQSYRQRQLRNSGFGQFAQSMMPDSRLNYFNIAYRMPVRLQDKVGEGQGESMYYKESIFNFKYNQLFNLCTQLQQVPNEKQKKELVNSLEKSPSYSEAFFLKGVPDDIQMNQVQEYLKTYQLNARSDSNVFFSEQILQEMFQNDIKEPYGQKGVQGFAYETCLFCHPSQGDNLRFLDYEYHTLPYAPIQQFLKDDVNNKDIIYEAVHNLKNQMEDYLLD